jgi:cysteinyl-tRNA synthetase
MAIHVYNTLTKTIEPLNPIVPGKLSFFVCGPTVYDHAHLGHGKTYTQFDFIVKYLRYRGYEVTYLQNITDIDDKIIARAQKEGVSPSDIAHRYEESYLQDMTALDNTSVDMYARAHDHIEDIVRQIKTLVDQGVAYQMNDGYYFDMKRFEDYGQLSGRVQLEHNDAVSRIDENKEKRNPGDFCLWKFRKEGEPHWESELGQGRPGWHVEDTAITEHYFGPQYDIHGGAIDLIFPHHEAEIAIMEMVSGKKPLVRHWIHTGFLNLKAEKMSKSLGNFVTIKQALSQVNYRVLRYIFISSHYKSTLDFVPEMMTQAQGTLERIQVFLKTIDPGLDDAPLHTSVQAAHRAIITHLDHNFDTPQAFATLFDFIREVNKAGEVPGKRVYTLMQELNQFFGLFDFTTELLDQEIQDLLDQREVLRSSRQFADADGIRDLLITKGIILEDTPQGLRWRRKIGA